MSALIAASRSTWLVHRLAELREAGALPVSTWVLPTKTFFPSGYHASFAGLDDVISRTLALSGLSFVRARIRLFDPETGEVVDADKDADAACGPTGCGACGPSQAKPKAVAQREVSPIGDHNYEIFFGKDVLSVPQVLAARAARAVGAVFMHESGFIEEISSQEVLAVAELAAISIGLGALVLPGAAVTSRGCGGARVSCATALPPTEMATAVALVAEVTSFDVKALFPYLEDAPKQHLLQALELAAHNRGVARTLREDPASLKKGVVQLRDANIGIGARLLSWLRPKSVDQEIDELERSLDRAAR